MTVESREIKYLPKVIELGKGWDITPSQAVFLGVQGNVKVRISFNVI